jgi:hypothetical protein
MPFPEIHLLALLPWENLSWRSALPPLFFLSLLSALGAHLTAVLAEAAALAGRRAFWQKYALQASQLAFWAGIPFCLLGPFSAPPLGAPSGPDGPASLEILRTVPPPFLWILPSLIHRFTWNPLRKHPGLHLGLGLATIPLNLGILVVLALGILDEFRSCAPQAAALPFLLPVFAHSLALAFAAAACFSLPWLFLQRAAADYGRDYYAFALRVAARQAIAATLASLVTGAALLALQAPPSTGLPDHAAAACGLSLLCLILWSRPLRSSSPLRHKPEAFAACLFFPLAAYIQFAALWRALIMV